jgi:peptidyl-prolyl cis-trans isomerase SurA
MRRQFIQKLRQKGVIAPIQPTEREARAFYDSLKTMGQVPKRPAAVTFRQIPVRPRADSAALARVRQRADSVLRELRRGADFAAAARRFSDDPATKEFGGDLGWFRRGSGFAREFEFVAFSLRPGQISDPVLTAFGYHIIQVQRVEPAEVQARHILFAPEITDEDRARTGVVADSLAMLLRAGAPFDTLARAYGDPTEEFVLDRYPRANLPEAYAAALRDARPGDVVGPFPAEGPGGVTKQVVVMFQEEVPEGEYTYEELRDQIRSRLAEEGVLKRYVALLRSQTYVDIRL